MRKNEEDQGTVFLRCGKAVLQGGAVAALTSVSFMLLAALGISQGLLGVELHYQLAVVSCVFGGFLGGVAALHSCPTKGLLVGVAVGGVLFLLQLTVGFLIYGDISLENGGVGLLCGALCGGAAAGILGGGEKKKSGKRKKPRRR